MEYYSAMMEDEILQIASTWAELENVLQSKMIQKEKSQRLDNPIQLQSMRMTRYEKISNGKKYWKNVS